jgi:hypothetical protein
MGVLLRVVVQDPTGEELVPGKPRLRVVREHSFGGVVDTRARPPKFVGPSLRPQVWHCGEAQESVLLDDRSEPSRHLVYGAMGGGKTELLAMWAWLQIIALTGTALNVGLTAPTEKRATILRDAMIRRAPAAWFRGGSVAKGWSERRGQFRFANGIRADVVSTHVSSQAEGSRMQGRSWGGGVGSDEIQDCLETDADSEIESRGRDAPRGIFRRLATCTPKISAEWRAFSGAKRSVPKIWALHHITGFQNPFTALEYLEQQRHALDEREYRRRVLGEEVPPERAVYPAFDRSSNVRPIPLGAVDITQRLANGFAMFGGNDPGSYRDVTELVRKYRYKERNTEGRLVDAEGYWVTGEVTTQDGFEQHVLAVKRFVQDRFNLQHDDDPDTGKLLVRCEPWSNSGTDALTHPEFLRIWKRHGIHAVSAAFRNGTGENARVPLEAGVEMMNRLLCNAAGERRLFIACDDTGKPCAPKLVEAFQSFERDAAYKAKGDKRHKEHDLSDWPMALTLALWPYEKLGPTGVRSVGAIY